MAFRSIGNPNSLTIQENTAQKTRAFIGDGTAFLKVPGLVVLVGIAVATANGRMQIPLKEDRLIMVHPDEAQPRELVPEDLFQLQRDTYETPVLLRSELSNHGIWQKGVEFFITGEWEDETPGGSQPVPSPETASGEPVSNNDNQPADEIAPDGVQGQDESPVTGADPDETTEDEQHFVDTNESFDQLPDAIKEGIRSFGSLDAALKASNAEYNAVGIKGNDIQRAKAALMRALKAAQQ